MNVSIYDHIKNNIKDGRLTKNFTLPENCEKEGVKFACGAMDGIMMYNFGGQEKDDVGGIISALHEKDILGNNLGDNDRALAVKEAVGTRQTLFLCDALQRKLSREKQFTANELCGIAIGLIKTSNHAETVKVGFSLLELIDTEKVPLVRELLRTFGLCDEFTLWCCYILRHYKDGNEEIFRLAQKVNGWGKVFAVKEFLEPETPEIRRWLLCSGCENDILGSYTAVEVFVKADVAKLLESRLPGDFDEREVHGLAALAMGLTDEGPMAGASALDEPKKVLESIRSVLVQHMGDEEFIDSAVAAIDSYEFPE